MEIICWIIRIKIHSGGKMGRFCVIWFPNWIIITFEVKIKRTQKRSGIAEKSWVSPHNLRSRIQMPRESYNWVSFSSSRSLLSSGKTCAFRKVGYILSQERFSALCHLTVGVKIVALSRAPCLSYIPRRAQSSAKFNGLARLMPGDLWFL